MLGQTFAPLGDPNDLQDPRRNAPSASPVQEAIKLLSLRIPRWTGSGTAPIPQPLLTGPGSAGLPTAENPIEQMLRKLLLGGIPTGGDQSVASQPRPSVPPPHVTPGLDGDGGQLPVPKITISEPPAPDPEPPQPRTPFPRRYGHKNFPGANLE